MHGTKTLLLVAVLMGPRAAPAQDIKAGGPGKPLAPTDAQKAFKLPPGLKIELVACEPQVESPVAISFDPAGRLWVVEMRDYPKGPAPGKAPEGRIRILEDRDGDGFFEHSQVFADNLLFANGLLHWKDGVIVTAAPSISWLRDTDGDGKVDKTQLLYEGFTVGNPQLRVSHPILGLDGFVYVANGLRGGTVRAAGADEKPINLGGMDFRFNLLTGAHEAISGMGQYGNTFDDWGNRFVCDNRHHLRHIVLENRYLKNNPHVAAPSLVEDISILDDGPLSSGGKIYPLSKNWTTSNLHEGRFTAACGVFIYRGGLLPKEYQGAALTCDPTGNLVHAESLTPHGPTFKARPLFDKKEFLATPDDWCRPVFLAHGPDDALYMVDMYRAVIEHPEFMPPELKTRPDLTLGKEKGRIWRIVSEGKNPAPVKLAGKSAAELVPFLASGNAWVRTTAFRLLLERADRSAAPLLTAMLREKSPRARLPAACLLDALGALDEEDLLRLLGDSDPDVARRAILLVEPRKDVSPRLSEAVRKLMLAPTARLAYQAALTVAGWGRSDVGDLADVLVQHPDDRWMRLAVQLAVKDRAAALVERLLPSRPFVGLSAGQQNTLVAELSTLVGVSGEAEAARQLLGALQKAEARPARSALVGLSEGLARRGGSLRATIAKLYPAGDPTHVWLDRVVDQALAVARKEGLPADRLQAVALIAEGQRDVAEKHLLELLHDEHPVEVKLAAIRALGRYRDKASAAKLLAEWKSLTPTLRREVVEGLLRQPATLEVFFAAIEDKKVKSTEVDPVRARQLLNHPQPAIRERAKKLLAAALPADRKEVLEKYQAAIKLAGDAKKGKALFAKHCITCHKVAGIGLDVGPDISDTRTRTAAALLVDILNPNQAIDANYVQYVVSTKSGRILTGILATETASSVTLKRAEGQTDVVPRADIESIESTGLSLMPDGLERAISVEEMADLIAFLKNWRYLDGSVPVGP